MRRLFRFLAGVLAVLIVLAALVVWVLEEPPGQDLIARALGHMLSSPAQSIVVTGLRGTLPFDIHVARITVADPQGVRAVIHNANAEIAPAALLHGQLTIDRLAIGEVELPGTAESQGSSAFDVEALVDPPLPVTVKALAINRIALAKPVVGVPLTFGLSGSFAVGGGSAEARLALDQIGGDDRAKLDLAYADGRLSLDATAREPSGAVLAALLGRAAPLPLTLAVQGAGPLDQWQGMATVHAGSEAGGKFRLTISGAAPYRIALDGRANVVALLPPKLRPLAAGTVTLAAEASMDEASFALDRLVVARPEQVAAHGHYDRTSGTLSGAATMRLADLGSLAPLAGTPISGSATLALDLSGTLEAPAATITVDAANIKTTGARIAAAHAALDARAAPGAPIALAGGGTVAGIAPAPAALAQRLDWSFAGRLDRGTETLTLDRIGLSDGSAAVTGAATVARNGATGTLHLALADLGALDGGALGGTLEAAADLRVAADGSGTAVVSGTASPIASARLQALLGSAVQFAGTIERRADGAVAAHDLSLNAAAASLTGTATRNPDGTIAADFTGALPRLGLLDPRLSGAATARTQLAGPLDALHGTVTLDAPALVAYGRRIAGLNATLDLASLAPARGQIAVHGRVAGLAVEVRANAAFEAGTVTASDIEASAGGAKLTGALTLRGTAVAGRLAGRIPDLAPFSALLGTKVAGQATLDARAQGDRYEITLDGMRLRADAARVARLRLTASISNPLDPSGSATLTLASATIGNVTVASAKLAAQSERPGRFALTAAAQGHIAQPVTLMASGSLALADGGATLDLARLDGRIGGLPLRLSAPLEASWRKGNGRFAGLALAIGSGRLSGDGSIVGSKLALHLLARDLPVHALAGLANREAEGTLGFEVTLAGTRRAPEAQIIVDGEHLRFAAAARPDLPAFGLVARADWRQGRVSLAGRLAGPRSAAIGWRGSAPLVPAANGLLPTMPRSGAVAFRLEGDGDLGAFSDLIPSGEDRVAGRFTIELDIAGTVGAPDASGRLAVTGGRYENFATGAVLDGVSFALVGDRDRLVLQNFTANDGEQGTVRVTGAVDLAAAPLPQFELSGALDHFRALRRDEGSATASGRFTLAGSIAAPRLEANLTIDEADLAVPEKSAPALTPVKAVLINSNTGAMLTPKAEEAAQPSPLETLALDVHIRIPGKTFVRGRGLDSEWRGAVTITGTTHAPSITGALQVVHGTFNMMGVTFVLTKGEVRFLGGGSINPEISIEATARSNDITAIVDLSGTATQPTIKLSSQPALPRDEVLSRLLFGTSLSQVTPAQGVQIASAAASLAGGQSLDVLGKIRTGLGLDRLSLGAAQGSVVPGLGVPSLQGTPGQPGSGPATGIGTTPLTPGSTAAGGLGGTAINAGKYVANGVYVGVSQGVGTSSSTVTVEVDVSRHITINTQAGQASGTGVGVTWKLDY